MVYVADTNLGRLWAIDIESRACWRRRPGFAPGRVVCNLPGYQLLDSLAVEAGGKVCVATIINGGITAFDPDGTTEHYPFPDLITTNICFGGADMRTAWVTARPPASSARPLAAARAEAELQRLEFKALILRQRTTSGATSRHKRGLCNLRRLASVSDGDRAAP